MMHRDRIAACLVGGAIGDALGYPVEFCTSTEEAAEALRVEGGVRFDGVVSDDTQMTLFSVEAIEQSMDFGVPMRAATREAYLRWYGTQTGALGEFGLATDERLRVRRGPGSTCMSALETLKDPAVPTPGFMKGPINNSKGCGGIMRVAPFGIAAKTYRQAFDDGLVSAAITHCHPAGHLSAAVWAAVIHGTSHGETLIEAISHARLILHMFPGHAEVERSIMAAFRLVEREQVGGAQLSAFGESLGERGGGWTGEAALGIALAVSLEAELRRYATETALYTAVAHAGDSDSTGALVGQLLGSIRGPNGLPRPWVAKVELSDLLYHYADVLARAATTG